ncbi:uncharacterized protein TNCV_759811 [Trichonephila clavipes]|nr:uncharacterized protein TNCV_759811 [Trichonephila clavipes]
MRVRKQWTDESRTTRKNWQWMKEGSLPPLRQTIDGFVCNGLVSKVRECHQVVFSDESCCNLWNHDGRIRVKRFAGKRSQHPFRMNRPSGDSPSLVSQKRHCCRASAADKGSRVYPSDPRPDAVVLYSGYTPGQRQQPMPPELGQKVASENNNNNSCRGVISEPDLLSTPESEILEAPQLSQTYAEVAKPSTVTSTAQTDKNITQIKCPPLQLLQPLLSVPQPDKSNSVSTLSSATQADLLPSTSSIAATVSGPPHLIPVSNILLFTTSNMFTPIEPSSSIISASLSNLSIQPPSASSTQNLKKKSKPRDR